MQLPTIEKLVEHGVHFGHRSSRWNPKMEPFIFATRNQVHVINLEKTLDQLQKALGFLQTVASQGGTILFVSTKRQARESVKAAAESCGMPYVVIRWLGGTFTNFRTIQKTIRKLEKLHSTVVSDDFELKYTKKERLTIQREIQKLENLFAGIKNMKKLPDVIFVIDAHHERITIREANLSKIKVVAVVDTNTDPNGVDYVIPANDDAIKSIALLSGLAAEAVNEGKKNLQTNVGVNIVNNEDKKNDS